MQSVTFKIWMGKELAIAYLWMLEKSLISYAFIIMESRQIKSKRKFMTITDLVENNESKPYSFLEQQKKCIKLNLTLFIYTNVVSLFGRSVYAMKFEPI